MKHFLTNVLKTLKCSEQTIILFLFPPHRHGRSPDRVDWEEAATGPQKRKGRDWQKKPAARYAALQAEGEGRASKVHSPLIPNLN